MEESKPKKTTPFNPEFNPEAELLGGKSLEDLTLEDIKNSIENEDFIHINAPKGQEFISKEWFVAGVTDNGMLIILPVEDPNDYAICPPGITLEEFKNLVIKK